MKVTEEQVIEASNITNSAAQAARFLGIKVDTYKKYALKLGCYKTNKSGKGSTKKKIRKHSCKCFDVYFDKIDTELKAYFLGFIAADGSISGNSLRLNISRKDRIILEKFCEEIDYSINDIIDCESYYYDENNIKHTFDASSLRIFSCNMINSLKKYNIVERKSKIDNSLFPNDLAYRFKNAWLTGYIDGDGCIKSSGYGISIVSNKSTIDDISDYLKKRLSIDFNMNKIGDITYELSCYKKHDVVKLCLLYKYSSDFHLERKYILNESMIEHYLFDQPKYSCNNFNKRTSNIRVCCDCGKSISSKAIRCKKCSNLLNNQSKNKPERNILKNLIRIHNFVYIGDMFGVSDNAVRKWCKSYDLPFKSSDIRLISDEDWLGI